MWHLLLIYFIIFFCLKFRFRHFIILIVSFFTLLLLLINIINFEGPTENRDGELGSLFKYYYFFYYHCVNNVLENFKAMIVFF